MNHTSLKTHANGVYGLRYQLTLRTDQRRPLLTPRVRARLEQLVEERVNAWDGELFELRVQPDHLTMSFELPPTAALSEFVRALKTGTSRRLRNEFAGLRSRPRLWETSYFVTSVAGSPADAHDAYLTKDVA